MRLPHASVSRRWASLCKQGSAQPRHQQALAPPRTRPAVSDPVSGLSCYRERWPFHPHTGGAFSGRRGQQSWMFMPLSTGTFFFIKIQFKRKSGLRGHQHVVCLDIRAEVHPKAVPSDGLENQMSEETAGGGRTSALASPRTAGAWFPAQILACWAAASLCGRPHLEHDPGP